MVLQGYIKHNWIYYINEPNPKVNINLQLSVKENQNFTLLDFFSPATTLSRLMLNLHSIIDHFLDLLYINEGLSALLDMEDENYLVLDTNKSITFDNENYQHLII